MDPRSPEAVGQAAAEALLANLEKLKHDLGGGADASLDRQLRAGEIAVEAMKHMMAGAMEHLNPPQKPE